MTITVNSFQATTAQNNTVAINVGSPTSGALVVFFHGISSNNTAFSISTWTYAGSAMSQVATMGAGGDGSYIVECRIISLSGVTGSNNLVLNLNHTPDLGGFIVWYVDDDVDITGAILDGVRDSVAASPFSNTINLALTGLTSGDQAIAYAADYGDTSHTPNASTTEDNEIGSGSNPTGVYGRGTASGSSLTLGWSAGTELLGIALAFVPAPAGNDLISGSSSITFTPTGALSGKGALSGSSSITFTPTGALAAKGALAGSSSITFTPTGNLLGIEFVSGSTSITFTPTGALAGKGALSGASSITFTPSGNLVGSGQLIGATGITFTPSGSLTGKGALAGSTTITFTPTGHLGSQGSLSGSTSITFTATGVLTGIGSATRNTPIDFSITTPISSVVRNALGLSMLRGL